MAALYPYIASGCRTGQKVDLKLHEILWKSVGRGNILSLSDYEVDVAGHLSVIVYSGALHIRLRLLDANDAAVVGPCVLQINSHVDEEATYRVDKGALAVAADFDGRRAGIRLSRDHGGKMTRCDLGGYLSLTAYLKAVS
jgi:hypothetical protein